MAAPSSAAKTVLAAGGVLTALTLAQAARSPSSFYQGGVYKRVWAIGVVTLALGVAADFAAPVIVPFAVAMVVGFALKNPGAFGGVFGAGADRDPGPAGKAGAGASSGGQAGRPPDAGGTIGGGVGGHAG